MLFPHSSLFYTIQQGVPEYVLENTERILLTRKHNLEYVIMISIQIECKMIMQFNLGNQNTHFLIKSNLVGLCNWHVVLLTATNHVDGADYVHWPFQRHAVTGNVLTYTYFT
jgi:hypothetical protein